MRLLPTFLLIITLCPAWAQRHADSLLGGTRAERTCYDVLHYGLILRPDFASQTLAGQVRMRFRLVASAEVLQVDLDSVLAIDSIVLEQGGRVLASPLVYRRDARAVFISLPLGLLPGGGYTLVTTYHGRPQTAANPPWEGGVVWRQDSLGRPWLGTACQGMGASLWWPCKDDLADEADSGATLTALVPDGLQAVSNGTPLGRRPGPTPGTHLDDWALHQRVAPYTLTLNVGAYVLIRDTLAQAGKAPLPIRIWWLAYAAGKAQAYLPGRIKQMLSTYEHLYGPYPGRADGYQLCQTAYRGMEHQGCISHGAALKESPYGYDFILVHESGHEWWGNACTVADNADLWVQEGFCTYGEVLFLEATQSKTAASRYRQYLRAHIRRQTPMQGPKGIYYDDWRDADIYYRAATMIHTWRLSVGDDRAFLATWRAILAIHENRQASTEAVLAIIAARHGPGTATYMSACLASTADPIIEIKGRRFRMPALGPGETFNAPLLKDGKPYGLTAKPTWQHLPQGDFRADPETAIELKIEK